MYLLLVALWSVDVDLQMTNQFLYFDKELCEQAAVDWPNIYPKPFGTIAVATCEELVP